MAAALGSVVYSVLRFSLCNDVDNFLFACRILLF